MDEILSWFAKLPAAAQATIVAGLVSAAVTLLLGFFNPFVARRLERLKSDLSKDLERKKTDFAKELSESDARTSYEFDARKRLYNEIEPLFFSLYEAAEGSYYRVVSLARTHRQGNLGAHEGSWLSRDGYYLRSTVYRIFLPLAILRLIQRSATFVDIELDENVRTRYFLLKLSYYAITDDFVFAKMDPKLEYSPNVSDWREQIKKYPERYSRQGLVIGHLDRLIDALIVTDDGTRRPMNYGEFELHLGNNKEFTSSVANAMALFTNFDFVTRPILARAILAHAFAMRLLLQTYSSDLSHKDLLTAVDKFKVSKEAAEDLQWEHTNFQILSNSISAYVKERLNWLRRDDYEII